MFFFHNDTVLKKYKIDLGFAPVGDKYYEGDGKTPEGDYFINRKNPYSNFIFLLEFHIRTRLIGQRLRHWVNLQVEIFSFTANQIAVS